MANRTTVFKAVLRLLCGCAVLAVLFAVSASLAWLAEHSLAAFIVLAGGASAWIAGGAVQIIMRDELPTQAKEPTDGE